MAIQFPCSQCKKTLSAAEEAVGRPVMCTDCGKVTRVPSPSLFADPLSSAESSFESGETLAENREVMSEDGVGIVQKYVPPVSLRQIESQTGWAIIVSLCFMPLGIVGMVFGSMAKAEFQAGNYTTAKLYYRRARLWTTIAVGLWIVIFLGLVLSIILPALAGTQQ